MQKFFGEFLQGFYIISIDMLNNLPEYRRRPGEFR